MRFSRPLFRSDENVAGAIYCTVLVLGIIGGTSEAESLSLWADLVIVLVTMGVFWLAHIYAALLAVGVTEQMAFSWSESAGIARHEAPLLQAAVAPCVPLLLGALGILGRTAAIRLSFAIGIAALFGWGLVISRHRQGSTVRTLVIGSISAGLGLVVALLHALFAH
jgi:hypothetical protein